MKGKIIALATFIVPLLVMSGIALADDVTVNAGVSAYITVTANYDTVTYGDLTSPSANNTAPSQATGIYNFTVDTNKNYKVYANATDFSGAGTINNENLRIDTDTDPANLAVGNSKIMDTTPTLIDNNIAYSNGVNYHGFWLTIPAAQPFGAYSTTLTVTISNVA
jgi:hypothetical protein